MNAFTGFLMLIDNTILIILQIPVLREILVSFGFFCVLGLFVKAKNAAKH